MLGFSAKTIRRDIASMPDDVRKMSLACPSDVPVMSLTEYGLKWLAEKHGVPFSGSSPDGSSGRQQEKQESENELVFVIAGTASAKGHSDCRKGQADCSTHGAG